jgi:hypothetical protein
MALIMTLVANRSLKSAPGGIEISNRSGIL